MGKKCRTAEILDWAFIRGPRLDPPHPLTHALEPLLGQRRSEQSQVWPSFWELLLTCSWKSQGNPPSTPAPVICPSMCQSSRTRWQAHDDIAIVLFPLCCLDISNRRKRPSDYGISVSSGMLGLARTLRFTMERQHVCELCKLYWERLRYLAHECSTELDKTCLWKQTIRSHLAPWSIQKPWTMSDTIKRKLQLDLSRGRKCSCYEGSLVKVHTFSSFFKMVFQMFQLSGGNPFLATHMWGYRDM